MPPDPTCAESQGDGGDGGTWKELYCSRVSELERKSKLAADAQQLVLVKCCWLIRALFPSETWGGGWEEAGREL